jgi:TonB-linked SusC/RagA family outer membrane protein
MRTPNLAVFPLCVCLMMCRIASAQSGGLISLTERNAPLEKVLQDIRDRAGFAYLGEGDWPQLSRPLTFSVKNMPVEELVKFCFSDQPLLIYTLNIADKTINVAVRPRVERIINGVIQDENMEPIGGANIIAPDDASTISRDDGHFSLKTHYSDPRLLVSSIGFESRVVAMPADGRELILTLQSKVGEMKEATVVHTGYQTKKDVSTTGSFDVVDNDLLNRRVSTNVLDRIDGVTSSVLFNKNVVLGTNQSTITVRGRSTIYGNPNPLVVVDNFPYPGDLNNINPADVESITILKDAAAAAIWGAFSGNGVIVITTKKGRLNQAPKISFNSSVTTGWKPNLYYQPILSSSDYIDIEEYLNSQGYYSNSLSVPSGPALSPVVELLGQVAAGSLDSADAYAQINALRKVDTRKDLGRYFYQHSLNSQYSLNVSGGGSQDQYYLSAGYDQNSANLERNEYDRVTLTARNSYRIVPSKLELTTGFAFTASSAYLNNAAGSGVMYPYAQLADAHGNALPVNYVLRQPYADTAGGGQLLDWHYRPLQELRNANNKLTLTDYRIDIGLRYAILKGLEARIYYQFGRGDSDFVNYNSPQTWFARNLINEYTQNTGGVFSFPVPRGGILNETMNTYTANNVRTQLSYNDSLFRHGRLNMIAGAEVRDIEGSDRTTRLYGYDPGLGRSVPVDYVDLFPQYTGGGSTQIPFGDAKIGTAERYLSYYTNAEYTYLGRYMVSGSVRRDESNLLGVRANQKGVPLWSAGLGWELSREKFYHLDGLPFLKLRLTDGYNGNIDRSVSAYTTASINAMPNAYNAVYSTIVNPPNPDLRWERVHIVNAGLDFATSGNRLGGSLEYYIKSGVDLIGLSPEDPTTGVSVFEGNTANMQDHGVDLTLHADNDFGKVHWNNVFLFSYVLDRVTKYNEKLADVDYYLSASTINPLAGKPLYSIYALRWEGLDPNGGNPQGLLNGKVSQDYGKILGSDNFHDLVYKGPVNPPAFGSWRSSFYWKQWGISANILYKVGYVFRRNSIFYNQVYAGSSPGSTDYEKRWLHPGDEQHTHVPSMTYPGDPNRDEFYQHSTVLVEKGDNIRLQDVQLSYDWTKQAHSKLPVQLIHLYLYGNNLGILWKANHAGIDPDYVTGMPQPGTLAIGVRVDY